MRQENSSFIAFPNDKSGLVFDESDHEKYPIRYYNVINGEGLIKKHDCSYYAFVYEGQMDISRDGSVITVDEGMYISFNSYQKVFIPKTEFKAIFIEVLHTQGIYPLTNFMATFNVGGPIEGRGRLKYIDGCTDSLLIPPIKMGDPCLNHLHFPHEIVQTPHTHPSHRIGIVAKGHGECVTPFGVLPLVKGMIFVIKEWDGKSYDTGLDGEQHPVGTHKFNTEDSTMDVIAFHPDSDFGATDINHPMINRTIVNGKPANQIEEIMTKEALEKLV